MTWALVVAGLVVLAVALLYNSLVRARNRVDEAWAQVDVQLTRRHELVPNLVETVRAYAAHEREVFARVAEARTAAVDARRVSEQARAEDALGGALRSLFAVAEAYPQLEASASFLELQRELTSTEDRIAYSRQYYNGAVRRYDTRRQTVPTSLVAATWRFEDREYFEVTDTGVRRVPDVGA